MKQPTAEQIATAVDDLRWIAEIFPDSKVQHVSISAANLIEALASGTQQ